MRFSHILTAIFLILCGSTAFGQYYMFDIDEGGGILEYGRADYNEVTTDVLALSIKAGKHSGIYLSYAKASYQGDYTANGYGLGYEFYAVPRTDSPGYPVAVASVGLSSASAAADHSVTSLDAGLALGYMAPVGEIGRSISSAGLVLAAPINSGQGYGTGVHIAGTIGSTIGFRLTPGMILTAGLSYVVQTEDDADNYLQVSLGLGFATKKGDDF